MISGFGESYVCETHKTPVYLNNSIEGGKIISICQDTSTGTIEVMLDAQQSGKMTLEIPRSIADPRKSDCKDDRFMVMEHRYMSGGDPWVDARYSEKSTNTTRILTIQFEALSEYITITGSKGLLNKITGINCEKNNQNSNQDRNAEKISNLQYEETNKCKKGLVNVQKPNNTNICVKPATAKKLLERWDKVVVQKIDTKCSDPWDGDDAAYDLATKYMEDHPNYDNLNEDDRFALQTSVFREFIESKGITIFDIRLKKSIEQPDSCNECDCNTGGHAWQFIISRNDLAKMQKMGFEIVK